MNKLRILTAASLFVMASSLLAPPAAYAVIVSSATTCQAANLNQAIKGIGWSQAGIKNNATIPLFVVCPLILDSNAPPTFVYVLATFPGSTGTVACTARSQALSGGTYTSAFVNITSGQPPDVGTNRGRATAALNPAGGGNFTVVCALDPGEGIETVVGI